MLHVAIHDMTPSQKRIFRLEMHRLNKGSSYELLFNYLDAQKVYNEQHYRTFLDSHNIQNHATLVAYLFDKLIIVLYRMKSAVRKDKVTIELENLYEKATSVTELGFYDYAAKVWLRVLKLADKNDKFRYTSEAVCNLRMLEQTKKIDDFDFKDGLDLSVYQRLEKCGHHQLKQMQLQILYRDAVALSTMANPPKVWDHPQEFKLLENPPPDDYTTLNFYYAAKGLYFMHTKGIEATMTVFKEYVEKQQQHISALNFSFRTLFDAHYLYGICLYWCVSKEEFITEANHFGGLFDKYNKIIPKIHKREHRQMAGIFGLQNGIIQSRRLTYEKSYTLEDIHALYRSTNWKYGIKNTLRTVLFLHLAFLCLVIKAYEAFQEYCSFVGKMIAEGKDSTHFLHELNIIQLIELYENNSPTYFKNQLETFIRKIRKNNDATPTVVNMTQLLRALYKSESPAAIMKDMLPEIKEQEKLDQSIKRTLPFFIWIERRVQDSEVKE